MKFCDVTDLFLRQAWIQREVYPKFMEMTWQERFSDNIKHLMHEAVEVERETNFKHWKAFKAVNANELKGELADVFIFFMNLCNEAEFNVEELVEKVAAKQNINIERQRKGY